MQNGFTHKILAGKFKVKYIENLKVVKGLPFFFDSKEINVLLFLKNVIRIIYSKKYKISSINE